MPMSEDQPLRSRRRPLLRGVFRVLPTDPPAHAASLPPVAAVAWWPVAPRHAAPLPALLLALIVVVLLIWQRRRLARAWRGFLYSLGALLASLRGRHHVIHDRTYLEKIVEAEIESDPLQWQQPPSGPQGLRRASGRGRRTPEGRRQRRGP